MSGKPNDGTASAPSTQPTGCIRPSVSVWLQELSGSCFWTDVPNPSFNPKQNRPRKELHRCQPSPIFIRSSSPPQLLPGTCGRYQEPANSNQFVAQKLCFVNACHLGSTLKMSDSVFWRTCRNGRQRECIVWNDVAGGVSVVNHRLENPGFLPRRKRLPQTGDQSLSLMP